MSARAQLTPFALIVLLTNFGSQLLQTIAALLGHRLLECIDIQPLTVALFKLTFLLRRQSLLLIGQQLKPTIQKTEFEFRKPGFKGLTAVAQSLLLDTQPVVFFAVGHQRLQQQLLMLGLQNCFMGTTQIIKMCNQCADASSDIKRFKHVAADELGQVAHRFHRNRLMKQFQRLFVIDTKAPPKPRTVLGETVLDIRPLYATVYATAGCPTRNRRNLR